MSDLQPEQLKLEHRELVSLYVFLSHHEDSLDECQCALMERICSHLYQTLSVSEMESIEGYYHALGGRS